MVDLNQPISVCVTDRDKPSVPAVPRAIFDVGVGAKPARRLQQPADRRPVRRAGGHHVDPILLYPWPPLSDYVNHLSRMHIIATIGSDPDLARFYEINWQVVPNLMVDLVVPVLERVMNVLWPDRSTPFRASVLILSRHAGAQSPALWPLFRAAAGRVPLLYNNVFLVGTMNYVFGIGLSLWALVAWISLRERGNIASVWRVGAVRFGAFLLPPVFGRPLWLRSLLAFGLHRLGVFYARRPAPNWPILRSKPSLLKLIEVFCRRLCRSCRCFALLLMSPTWNLRGSFLCGNFTSKSTVSSASSRSIPTSPAFLLTGIVAFAARWGMRHRALKGFHSFRLGAAGLGSVTYLCNAAGHFRNLHGGSAVADLARLHGDRPAPISICAINTCAHRFCHRAGSAAGDPHVFSADGVDRSVAHHRA